MHWLRMLLLRILGADEAVLERDVLAQHLLVAGDQIATLTAKVANLQAERDMWRNAALQHGAPER